MKLRVEKLVTGGEGLGRLPDGRVALVPRVVPGDEIELRVTEERGGWVRGVAAALIAAGPDRRTPPCAVAERCGGCDLQHVEDAAQGRLKLQAALETLARVGRLDVVARLGRAPELIAGAAWGWRTRASLHVERRTGGAVAGWLARGTDELVAVARCPILHRDLERWLAHGAPARAANWAVGERRRVDVLAGERGEVSVADGGPEPVEEFDVHVGGVPLRVGADGFFQAHRELAETLVARAVGATGGGTCVELYAGVGLFSIPLARRHDALLAVESHAASARRLAFNLRRAGCAGARVLDGPAESALEQLPRRPDRVLVDPPRAGLSRAVRRWLVEAAPARLTIVSCDPATLARDLAALSARFALDELLFVDLFPQTSHLETVVHLRPLSA